VRTPIYSTVSTYQVGLTESSLSLKTLIYRVHTLINLTALGLLISFSVIVMITLGVIWYTGSKLADQHGSDLRIVWYFFSLSSVCTALASAWASKTGAIDQSGSFQGAWGKKIESILTFMLDLDTDIKAFAALLMIFVIPQIASYFLSGIFGRASSPIFIGRALSLFIWSIVKSFVVASGILLTIAIYGMLNGWAAWNTKGAASMSFLSLMLLMLSFFFLFVYRDIDNTIALPTSDKGLRIQRRISALSAWLTRKEPSD